MTKRTEPKSTPEKVTFIDTCYKQRTLMIGETGYQVTNSRVEVSDPDHIKVLDKNPYFKREKK